MQFQLQAALCHMTAGRSTLAPPSQRPTPQPLQNIWVLISFILKEWANERVCGVPGDSFTQPTCNCAARLADFWVKWWGMSSWWRPCLQRLCKCPSSSGFQASSPVWDGIGREEEDKWTNELHSKEEELSQKIGQAWISSAEKGAPQIKARENRSGKIQTLQTTDCTNPRRLRQTIYVCWPRHPQGSSPLSPDKEARSLPSTLSTALDFYCQFQKSFKGSNSFYTSFFFQALPLVYKWIKQNKTKKNK